MRVMQAGQAASGTLAPTSGLIQQYGLLRADVFIHAMIAYDVQSDPSMCEPDLGGVTILLPRALPPPSGHDDMTELVACIPDWHDGETMVDRNATQPMMLVEA